uniref:Uncharacterized protein n=1 Tax=Siphoviridae sp. ctvok7 TaxID=2827596 RepID=A0A8S5LLN7_9CAUD|nr:MAG TPA: hypothetical protein [Siphoviridae sp. ctvok7]
MVGSKVAVFTDTRMYIGTLEKQFDFVTSMSVSLVNVAVSPIVARPDPDEVIALPEVLILWDKVVAVAPADGFQVNVLQPEP